MPRGVLEVREGWGPSYRLGGTMEGPSARMWVHSPRHYRACLLAGDIGFGESYVDGHWDTADLVSVIGWFCANSSDAPTMSGSKRAVPWINIARFANAWRHSLNRNSPAGSRSNIRSHYDLGNEFYRLWLDPTMTYSSALFERPGQDLESAQIAKYDRLCRHLRLKPSDHVLEIGSGWGGFASHAVRKFGCRVTTITLSSEQLAFANAKFQREGIADRAEARLSDYRDVQGSFDKICSIEMLEAVGDRFLEAYFGAVHRLLKRDGLFAAQFITCPDSRYDDLRRGVDWIQKHIFPGSLLLSLQRVSAAIRETGDLWLQDLKDLGLDYAETLRHWRGAFVGEIDAVRRLGFDERFIRAWHYYLAYCEAAFAWRNISVVQAVWSRPNSPAMIRPV